MSITERTTSELEGQLQQNHVPLIDGSKAGAALAQLKRARGHLAYLRLAVSAPATGFNLAGPDKDFASLTREEVTALAHEAAAYLESLIPPK